MTLTTIIFIIWESHILMIVITAWLLCLYQNHVCVYHLFLNCSIWKTCSGLAIAPLLTTTSSKAMAVTDCSSFSTTASKMALLTTGSLLPRAAMTRSLAWNGKMWQGKTRTGVGLFEVVERVGLARREAASCKVAGSSPMQTNKWAASTFQCPMQWDDGAFFYITHLWLRHQSQFSASEGGGGVVGKGDGDPDEFVTQGFPKPDHVGITPQCGVRTSDNPKLISPLHLLMQTRVSPKDENSPVGKVGLLPRSSLCCLLLQISGVIF